MPRTKHNVQQEEAVFLGLLSTKECGLTMCPFSVAMRSSLGSFSGAMPLLAFLHDQSMQLVCNNALLLWK